LIFKRSLKERGESKGEVKRRSLTIVKIQLMALSILLEPPVSQPSFEKFSFKNKGKKFSFL